MSKKVFVGGISWNSTDEDLKEHFSSVGTVVEAKIVLDRETGRSRGFGFVTFETEDEAKKAIEELDGSELDGRAIHVSEAKERADNRN